MELRKLRHFVVLAEELHFGRAAERLAMTQPPLSLSIQALEEELGVQLFERTRRSVALTHAGATFLVEARHILERTVHAVELARAANRGEVGRLAVGFMASSAYTLLPLVLKDFRVRFPEVRLDLRELTLPQQSEAFRRGEIEISLLRPPISDAALQSEIVLDESLVVALPAGHRLAHQQRVSLHTLADEAFVMYPRWQGLVLHDLIVRFCLAHGFTPRVAQEASQTHAVLGLVSAGIGVALVPFSAQAIGLRGLEYRPLKEKTPPVQTAVAWRRGDHSPVVAAFLNTVRSAAKQLADGKRGTKR
ncbi:MAG TPA: LysR substrate-binding domain-containing protein [Burkholderiales bacterium]